MSTEAEARRAVVMTAIVDTAVAYAEARGLKGLEAVQVATEYATAALGEFDRTVAEQRAQGAAEGAARIRARVQAFIGLPEAEGKTREAGLLAVTTTISLDEARLALSVLSGELH